MCAKRNLGRSCVVLSSLLLLPLCVSACWMLPQGPTIIFNDHLKIRFTYEGKPLAGARVVLRSKIGSVGRVVTNKEGWATFEKVKGGEYKIVLQSPSHETFDVIVAPSPLHKSVICISFCDDYCFKTETVLE